MPLGHDQPGTVKHDHPREAWWHRIPVPCLHLSVLGMSDMVPFFTKTESLTPKPHTLWIHIPSEKVVGDYLCRFGEPKYLLRRYVDP